MSPNGMYLILLHFHWYLTFKKLCIFKSFIRSLKWTGNTTNQSQAVYIRYQRRLFQKWNVQELLIFTRMNRNRSVNSFETSTVRSVFETDKMFYWCWKSLAHDTSETKGLVRHRKNPTPIAIDPLEQINRQITINCFSTCTKNVETSTIIRNKSIARLLQNIRKPHFWGLISEVNQYTPCSKNAVMSLCM